MSKVSHCSYTTGSATLVVLFQNKTVEHVLDDGGDRHLFLPEPHKNTY